MIGHFVFFGCKTTTLLVNLEATNFLVGHNLYWGWYKTERGDKATCIWIAKSRTTAEEALDRVIINAFVAFVSWWQLMTNAYKTLPYLKGSTKKILSPKPNMDSNGVWQTSFRSEGPKKHLKLKILVSKFFPWDLEVIRTWDLEATCNGTSRQPARTSRQPAIGPRGNLQ